ncbi:UDP-glucose/GDP-mannose dehydrogenase family protein [Porphyromonas sp.]|uniref:UDP-glucose dehydrogenase family protein n=1 Tax=Porphyromonas sp. TaxID=1924944 RepID=UPI0026DD29C6|nr:UDP-glucose/GDP-mannose dehydrogenase family protein [Porphyromonas sp.]MDO4770658.1 UDP-glucose/GDP-mannose dehydrogenase family protein [Porphyromonas sp.]
MKIAIVGTGYVGLVSGACFAEMGLQVYCVDINKEKIDKLSQGIIPIYEPGLSDLVTKNKKVGRLHFETSLEKCINEGVEVIFIAVGTPSGEGGAADLSAVYAVAKEIGGLISKYTLVVTKSTVPVGTTMKVKGLIREELNKRDESIEFDVASNPEFLKEGAAIKDFMSPDRVVVGTDSERAKEIMTKLYRPFTINNFRVIFMDIASSELTKYASNAMLATRISFMNEVANLCEAIGADVESVRKGMGADKRIGSSFLYAGCGYGGSCFPKDVKALSDTAKKAGLEMNIIREVDRINDDQKLQPYRKLSKQLGTDLTGKVIAVWGLAFKPETDDMREAPSIYTISAIVSAGGEVRAFDPVAVEEAKKCLPSSVYYAEDIYDAAKGADAVILLTEWKQFRMPAWERILEAMRGRVLIDGRNIYQPDELRALGFEYMGMGR